MWLWFAGFTHIFAQYRVRAVHVIILLIVVYRIDSTVQVVNSNEGNERPASVYVSPRVTSTVNTV